MATVFGHDLSRTPPRARTRLRRDLLGADALGALLKTAARDHGLTVICATHDPVLMAHADTRLDLEPAASLSETPPAPAAS